jgi:hypothetical protein
MKYLMCVLMLISSNCNAEVFAESTTMDGSRIVLHTEPCKAHKNSSEASIIKDDKIIALGCWKSSKEGFLVIWGDTLQRYSYKGWTLK